MKERNNAYVAQELLSSREGNLVAHVFEDKTLKDLQSLAVKLTSEGEIPVLLASFLENKVILANNDSSRFSCGGFFKANLGIYNGKGGGSDKMAQAGFQTWEEALAFYEFSRRQLNDNLG